MNDPHVARGRLTRRGLLGAGAAMAAGYALACRVRCSPTFPIEFDGTAVPARRARAEPEVWRRAAHGHHQPRSPHFDLHQSGTYQQPRLDGLHVRQPDPARSARRRQDHHSRPGAQLGDRQGRQDLHLLPAQGRPVPRRRGADVRGREGHVRPHREAAAGHQHPAQHPVHARSARSTRPTSTPSSSSCPSRGRPPSSCRRSPAAGTSSCARRRWRTTTTICARSSTIPAPGRSRRVRRVENEVWVMEKNKNYWNKGLPYLDGIEFYHLVPFSPELGSAILSGRVDYGRVIDPVTFKQGAGDARECRSRRSTRASSRRT